MLVYVIRHGESENNRAKKWTGHIDTPLTEKGINDAKKAGEYLKGIGFSKVFSSDLSRATATAENALPDYEYEVSELLREIDVGSLQNTPIADMTPEQKADVFENGYKTFGGETRKAFQSRIKEFMEKLEKSPQDRVAVFSHAGWLCGMLNEVIGVKIPRKHLRCDNCTIAVFEYQNLNWRLHSWMNL